MKTPCGQAYARTKFSRAMGFLTGLSALFVAVTASAQIDTILVGRRTDYVQGQTGGPTLSGATPYYFVGLVDGQSLSGTELSGDPSITGSASASFPSFDSVGHHWTYTSTGYSSLANLVTAFPDGSYNIVLPGNGGDATGISIGSTSAVNTPDLSLSGGTWINSTTYQISNTGSLMVTLNNAISGLSSDQFHYDLELDGANMGDQNNFAAAQSTPTFTAISLGSVAPGSYTLTVNFDDIQSLLSGGSATVGGLTNVTVAGLFSARTSINISVIPEPSTYAAIFGVIALAGVMLHRRRRMQAA